MSCTIRKYRATDLEDIVTLVNAADTVDKTEDGTSLQEMRDWLSVPGLAPEDNVFVAAEEDGRIVGYGFLRMLEEETSTVFRTGFQVHPIRRGRGLEQRLLTTLYARAEERLADCKTETVYFSSGAVATEHERIQVLEQFGMREVRRFWRMVRPTLDNVPSPAFPPGILTRAYRLQEDDAKMHQADTEVFRDHWGHADHPLELWKHYMAQPSIKPDLSVIAENAATGEIAGFCMIAINDEENRRLGARRGWIDILGTRRAYRRQGLGTALILAGLQQLREAGLSQAALGCDSENLTGATRIYERVGFRVDKVYIALRKSLREAVPAAEGIEQSKSYVIAS